MIRLGPAGIGSDALQGLRFLHEQGLDAAEVEFTHGVRMDIGKAKAIGSLAKQLGIRLSVHCPYYINLCSVDSVKVAASRARIIESCLRAHHLGADYVVFHPGYYGSHSKSHCYDIILRQVTQLMDAVRRKGWTGVLLAPETTGRLSQFGDLDELIRLSGDSGCSITVDFAHIWARHNGKLSFADVLDRLRLSHLHAHFSGIEYGDKGERRHIPMQAAFFKPLAEQLIKRDCDITIISESPDTWKDCLKMKALIDRLRKRQGLYRKANLGFMRKEGSL